MKIDKNKPLPDHTKLDYDECCAKLILAELFPSRYADLLIDDKPDLQGKEVGIEVTIANDKKHMEAVNNWVKANHCSDEKKKKKYIERMSQLGAKYTGGVQGWPPFTPSFDLTRKAIEDKIKKIQKGNYASFPRYELFIFTETWYYDEIVEKAKAFLFDRSISDYYKTVYILSEGCDLHIFETDTGNYMNIHIDSTEQHERNCRAREMVEEAESKL